MNTRPVAEILSTLLRELVEGSNDPKARTYVLNQGDPGLLVSLDRLTAEEASKTQDGGASIASHVDHLRYGMSLLNRWADGTSPPWPEMDWTASWRKSSVTQEEWKALTAELRREAARWREAVATPREVDDVQLGWMAGSIAHLAYHFGAIRQIDRATRGPTAEDEAQAQAQ